MTERIKELWELANNRYILDYQLAGVPREERPTVPQLFAELIVRECAQLARDTDLEDVEGGDSDVLRAAKRQILEHFGIE